jgi:3-oxoacyl-[acyl-carrier protein] reductase
MNLGLVGKVALVTGSSRGIGRAIALALASEGCKLALCARSAEPLERALEEVRSTGVEAIAEIADVRSRQEVETLVERLLTALGAAGGECDFGACAGHGHGRGPADAAAAAGYQGYSVLQFHADHLLCIGVDGKLWGEYHLEQTIKYI